MKMSDINIGEYYLFIMYHNSIFHREKITRKSTQKDFVETHKYGIIWPHEVIRPLTTIEKIFYTI